MSDYVLSLEAICKSFGGVKVLDNVDFKLKRGTTHALIGGNGAGKSTLMKILTGVYSKDEGVIKVNGEVTEFKTYDDARNTGISFIFQELSLVPTLSIVENIFLDREIKKYNVLNHRAMNEITKSLMKELNLDVDVAEAICNLDVGTCQMIEIAKALSVNASVIVMDEPTASLTEKETEMLFGIIENLKAKGVSIVYISHRMNEIFKVADEITVLRDGKKVATKSVDEYTMNSLISDIIGSKEKKALEKKKLSTTVSEENMLEVKGLTMNGKLNDISFKLKKGEVLGFAGLLGSGRTEVLESIIGLRNYEKGKIYIEDTLVEIDNVQQAIDLGIVLIPEDRRREGLVLEHTLKENIMLPNLKRVKNMFSISNKLSDALATQCIKDFRIKTDSINTPLENLSGGNQQKVVVSKWMKTSPRILLMDEPTAGIDVGAKSEIIDLVGDFVFNQYSVIFVSSELTELIAVCDRILIFHKGSIVGELKCHEIENEEVLQHAIQH